MKDFARNVVQIALIRQGLPYIWGGKGLICWSPTGAVPTTIKAGCSEAYDCIGLVTSSVFLAQGPDLRMLWSCQTLWNEGLPPLPGEEMRLRLFGSSVTSVDHVSIELGQYHQLEAAGGDSTTTNAMAAVKRGAKVRVSDIANGRQDFLGFRSLRALQYFQPKGTP